MHSLLFQLLPGIVIAWSMLLLLPFGVARGEGLHIASIPAIQGYEGKAFGGQLGPVYQDIAVEFGRRHGQPFVLIEPERGYRLFYRRRIACIGPGSVASNKNSADLIESRLFSVVHWRVYYPWPNRVLDEIEGGTIGIPYDEEGLQGILPKGNFRYVVNGNNLRLAKQLSNGYIDAIIAADAEMSAVQAVYQPARAFWARPGKGLFTQKLGFVCHDRPETRSLVALLNKVIDDRMPLLLDGKQLVD